MTNLDWMRENGYTLDCTSVTHDTDAGRIIFTAYKKQEFGDLREDDSINFTPLWAISYNPDDCPDDFWKWHMSVGFAKWLQEEHDDANFPKETFIWRK